MYGMENYYAALVPKQQFHHFNHLPIYFPQITDWQMVKGKISPHVSFQHESTFDGVYCVVGYIRPCDLSECRGVHVLSVNDWQVPIAANYIEHARELEASSAIEPVRKSFKRNDLVKSLDWFMQGLVLRVIRSNAVETECNCVNSGKRFKIKNYSLVCS